MDGTAVGDTATVVFEAGDASAGDTTVEADPDRLAADGVATSTVTVTVLDGNGNRVPGATVGLTVTGSAVLSSATAAEGTGDDAGTYTATVTSTKAETVTVSATVR